MNEVELETSQQIEDELYNFLDRYGADKRVAGIISRLIDVKITETIEALSDRFEARKREARDG